MKVNCRKVESIADFIDGIRLRVDAFIIEQGCKPGWEPDTEDKTAEHYIALIEDRVVGVLRVRTEDPDVYKIERMVSAKDVRGLGVGQELLNFVLTNLTEKGAKKIWLQAQVQARGFYERCNFIATSDEYDLHNIQHLNMEYVRT